METVNRFISNKKYILFLYLFIAIIASLQAYFSSPKTFVPDGPLFTSYNNYLIFKYSFFHIIQGQDLYVLYPEEYHDLYKYSPAFALLFGPLSIMPDLVGLTLWNILNALVLFYAVYYLPFGNTKTKGLILIIVLIELLTSLQNEQSNGLIAGLLVFSFGFLEKRKYWLASLCIVLSIYIKLFGIVAFALYLLYPNKPKLFYTTLVWMAIFTLAPFLITNTQEFVYLYKSWGNLLANDHSISDGISVIGWLKTWFGFNFDKSAVSLIGAALFCIPLLRYKSYIHFNYRILLLTSILIWVVIFNHRAESPTFVIAVAGVAIWYYTLKISKLNQILLLFTILFTILSATDIYPKFIKTNWFVPYVVKGVPCILIWIKIIYDMTWADLRPTNSAVLLENN